MLGLADPPPVPRLDQALAAPVVPPPPRAFLPGLGRTAGHRLAAGFACRPGASGARRGSPAPTPAAPRRPGPATAYGWMMPRSTPATRAGSGSCPAGIAGDRHLGGDIHPQPPGVVEQRHRPDLFWRVGQVPVQPHPQRRAAAGDRDPQPPARQREGAVVPAQRHQRPPPPREPRPLHRRPGGAWRRRTRHRNSGAAPTARPRCLTPRNVPGPDAASSRHSS